MFRIAILAATKNSGIAKRLGGLARVGAYFAVVGVVGTTVVVHKAKADIGENALVLGSDLLPLADLLKSGNTFNINGERIHLASTSTTDTPKEVLDRFETACKVGSANGTQVWTSIPDPSKVPEKALSSVPIIRQERGNGGTVSCFVKGALAEESLPKALAAFFQTGDFGKVGKLRYVTVGNGGNGTTAVISAWTDDSFNVKALAPPDGVDAPGHDPGDLPRPSNAQRILSGGLEKMPYAIYMYTTTATPAAAIADYDVGMMNRKWTVVKNSAFEASPHEGKEIRAYLYPGTGVQVYVTTEALDNGKTGIGISESLPLETDKAHSDTNVSKN